MLAASVTVTRRSIYSANSYCYNNDNNEEIYRGGIYVVLTVIVTVTGRYMCNVSRYCDNNGEVHMQY